MAQNGVLLAAATFQAHDYRYRYFNRPVHCLTENPHRPYGIDLFGLIATYALVIYSFVSSIIFLFSPSRRLWKAAKNEANGLLDWMANTWKRWEPARQSAKRKIPPSLLKLLKIFCRVLILVGRWTFLVRNSRASVIILPLIRFALGIYDLEGDLSLGAKYINAYKDRTSFHSAP